MIKIGDKVISLEFDEISMKYRVNRIKVAKIEITASGVSYYKPDTEYIGGHDMYRGIYTRIEGKCFETEADAITYLKDIYKERIAEFKMKVDLCNNELCKLELTNKLDN